MAYSFVKVQFEIGHEASLRSEVTSQGFTHDWQVFVRGADNAEIHHFVEKVVFNLHESFPKPKRVVKEPPYEVRESGYASFTFPIEVYLKTKDEPRKLDFIYDLSLNTSGPIRTSQREKRIFNNPSEEFRRKLIRGGGVGVGSDMLPLTDNNSQNTDDKSFSKKSSSESSKKHKSKDSLKPDEIRSSNQFADLFGTPIKTPAATKKISEPKHSNDTKVSSKSISKHSPHKEKEKEKESSKKDTMITTSSNKEKDKDRDRNKEKEKKTDKFLKRPSPAATPPSGKAIKEEPKKPSQEEAKEKEKVKSSSSDITKNEKKEKKKDKKSRDEKDKKDRHKDHESKKELSVAPPPPLPPIVEKDKIERVDKTKSDFKESKENLKKSPKNVVKEDKFKDKVDKDKFESVEKQRHKHKKKEKNKKEEKDQKEKEKSVKKVEKLPPPPPPPTPFVPTVHSPPPPPTLKSRARSPSPKIGNPLSTLLAELPDKGSDSESSVDEDAKSVEKVKITPPPPPPPCPAPPVARTPEPVKEDKFIKEKVKKKEKKSSCKDEDGSRKKKRKSKEKEEVIPEKIVKLKADEEQKVVMDEPMDEDLDERLSEPSPVTSPQRDDQDISRSRSPTPPVKFTDEYVTELKDLQQKIMTLEDNAELQRVVQVIAETGQYEITKKTFDFDLCALDKSTVKRLQDLFFAAS